MQWCLLCERVKPNDEFARDRASCRRCLAGCQRAPSPYAPYIKYAKQQWKANKDEAEVIAWTEIYEAERTFDPSRGMTLAAYIRLRIHNAIANARREARHFVPWTKLGFAIEDHEGGREAISIEEGIATQPGATGSGLRHTIDDPTNAEMVEAELGVRKWLLLSELFGDPVTLENAQAHFGVNDPLVGNAKAFGHAMKKLV